MLHTRLIRDLDALRGSAFPPPYALLDSIEVAEGRGERWWVLLAYESQGTERWLAVLPDSERTWFFTDGERLAGRWDAERHLFIPEDGSPLDLHGRPVTLASRDEEDEEEDAEYERRRR